jgi:Lar family restriction alleviation protein
MLNSCPFCQSRRVTLWTETDGNFVTTDAWVECDACSARGPSEDTEKNATEKWNAAMRGMIPLTSGHGK